MRIGRLALLGALVLGVAGGVVGAPYRGFGEISGGGSPELMWFKAAGVPEGSAHALTHQFYDNPIWPDFSGPGWGGDSDSMAVAGYVTEYVVVSGSLTQFTLSAVVTNDTYDYWDTLTGTAAEFGTFTAPDISMQRKQPLFDVRITANFADADTIGVSSVYAVGHDEVAFFGTSDVEPPVTNFSGGYKVPAWNMGDIGPGQMAVREMTFKLRTPAVSNSTLYNWVVSNYESQNDVFAARTRTTKIPMFPAGFIVDDGSAWPGFAAANSANVTVAFNEKPFVLLSRGDWTPFEHYWWSGMSRGPGAMLHLVAQAGYQSDVDLTGITLKASGTGNDKVDIATVSVYMDDNWDGSASGETLLGTGTFSADDGTCSVNFTSPVNIPAETSVSMVVAYTLASGVSPEKTYKFEVTGANALQSGTSMTVPAYGLPVASCTKKVSAVPQAVLTIGDAKKLPLGSLVMLQAKPVTGDVMSNTYIEEPMRTSGIALAAASDEWNYQWYPANRFVTVVGKTGVQEIDGQAVIKDPMLTDANGFILPEPLLMGCRQVGGGTFGVQRGTLDNIGGDDAQPVNSSGLNNVGLLVTVCGKVNHSAYGSMWIDDGSGLWDGARNDFYEPVSGLQVLLPYDMVADPAIAPHLGDYVMVTGIVTTQVLFDSPLEPKPLIKVVGARGADDVKVLVPAVSGP